MGGVMNGLERDELLAMRNLIDPENYCRTPSWPERRHPRTWANYVSADEHPND